MALRQYASRGRHRLFSGHKDFYPRTVFEFHGHACLARACLYCSWQAGPIAWLVSCAVVSVHRSEGFQLQRGRILIEVFGLKRFYQICVADADLNIYRRPSQSPAWSTHRYLRCIINCDAKELWKSCCLYGKDLCTLLFLKEFAVLLASWPANPRRHCLWGTGTFYPFHVAWKITVISAHRAKKLSCVCNLLTKMRAIAHRIFFVLKYIFSLNFKFFRELYFEWFCAASIIFETLFTNTLGRNFNSHAKIQMALSPRYLYFRSLNQQSSDRKTTSQQLSKCYVFLKCVVK